MRRREVAFALLRGIALWHTVRLLESRRSADRESGPLSVRPTRECKSRLEQSGRTVYAAISTLPLHQGEQSPMSL